MRCDQASPRIAWRLQAICLAKCYSNLQSTHRLRPKGNDVRAGHAESPFLFRVQSGCNWGAIADRRCGSHGRMGRIYPWIRNWGTAISRHRRQVGPSAQRWMRSQLLAPAGGGAPKISALPFVLVGLAFAVDYVPAGTRSVADVLRPRQAGFGALQR